MRRSSVTRLTAAAVALGIGSLLGMYAEHNHWFRQAPPAVQQAEVPSYEQVQLEKFKYLLQAVPIGTVLLVSEHGASKSVCGKLVRYSVSTDGNGIYVELEHGGAHLLGFSEEEHLMVGCGEGRYSYGS